MRNSLFIILLIFIFAVCLGCIGTPSSNQIMQQEILEQMEEQQREEQYYQEQMEKQQEERYYQ